MLQVLSRLIQLVSAVRDYLIITIVQVKLICIIATQSTM